MIEMVSGILMGYSLVALLLTPYIDTHKGYDAALLAILSSFASCFVSCVLLNLGGL